MNVSGQAMLTVSDSKAQTSRLILKPQVAARMVRMGKEEGIKALLLELWGLGSGLSSAIH